MLTRKFLPVGQGAFYVEKFKKKKSEDTMNIVYDCGSFSKEKLKKQIEKEFSNGENIDILFISHLHADHINGLSYLSKYCKIKNMVLPYMDDLDKDYMFLANTLESDVFKYQDEQYKYLINNLILNPKEIAGLMETNIIYHGYKLDLEISSRDNYSINSQDYFRKYRFDAECELKNWQLIPYVYRSEKNKHDDIFEYIKESILECENLSNTEIIEYVSKKCVGDDKKMEVLKKVYKKLDKDLNNTSMCLYSGCNSEMEVISFFSNFEKYEYCHPVGCLYLGDYDLKKIDRWNDFEKFYEDKFQNLRTIQVPHHGSSYNFNDKLLKLTNIKYNYIISAGKTNRYNHPHQSTLKKLISKSRNIAIVDEEGENEFCETIQI